MTILFVEDWAKYPNAIVNTQTKNKTFLRLASLYKEMGVKNHAFLLALHNPELLNVDPFNPSITDEEMLMVAIECKQNFWYFVREIVVVPGGSHDDPIRFIANRANMALFWLFFNHIMIILVQPRQTGKSFSTDELMTYLLNIRCTKTQINLLTKDDTLRAANLERLKNIELELPFYLKQRGKGDIGNTEELSIHSLGNSYRGHVPNMSPKMAAKVGRGLTSPIFQCDESAFFNNVAISLPAALAAGTHARELAKRKGDPYGTILTTTAGKKDDRDGEYIHNLLMNSAIWTEKLLDCANLNELETMIRNNSPSRELRVNCTFNHRQLGYTDEWLQTALEGSLAKGEDAERDFLNKWTSGSQLSPLPATLTAIIRESQIYDYYTEISSPHSYITRWYILENQIEYKMANSFFTMSMDTSDAAGGDDIGMVMRDIKSGEVVAAGNFNETNLITFCEWLVSWFIRFPNFVLIVERRSTGAMIIDYLILMLVAKDIDPFKRIYNKAVHEADEFPERFNEINKPMYARDRDIYVKLKKTFGFATSANGATSRTELYSTTLLSAAKMTGNSVKDVKTIDQILGLVIKNGRVDHPTGEHDDMAISWLLGHWFVTLGKNLSFYGINSKDVFVNNKVHAEDNSPENHYKKVVQNNLKITIENLIEDIQKEKDPYVTMMLETKLKNLSLKLDDADRNILSLDALMQSIRENKRRDNTTKRLW